MPQSNRLAFPLLVFVAVTTLRAQTPSPAQTAPGVRVTVLITMDHSPCAFARAVIRPKGTVEGWPEGKSQITLVTDPTGRASVRLGPGKYRVVAHDSMNIKLPADGWFAIKPGQRQPEEIHLNLLYWDCSHVTCML